ALGDHVDAVVRGRDHRAIVVVEVEVAAAREVAERVPARPAGRQREGRQRLERAGVEQRQLGPVEPDADRHDPPSGVEGDRGALAEEEGRCGPDGVPEGAAELVRVGHVRVVVDVGAAVRGHERVLRDRGRLNRLGDRGGAEEGGRMRGQGRARDRRRRHPRHLGPGAGREREDARDPSAHDEAHAPAHRRPQLSPTGGPARRWLPESTTDEERTEAPRADPGPQPHHQHHHPGLPRRPPWSPRLLQRGRGRAARPALRGARPHDPGRVARPVRPLRRAGRADRPRQPADDPCGPRRAPDARVLPHPHRSQRADGRSQRGADRGLRGGFLGRDDLLLAPRGGGLGMRIKIYGARGSVPAPGPHMNRYGGNTSCIQLTLASGQRLILDAGTGIRTLGAAGEAGERIHILLTHLHLDHIQGLMFFAPCFHSEAEITIWGPSSPGASLEARIGRYISAPLSPVEVRELPCSLEFHDAPASEWELGSASVRAEAVTHRGPTLGYRITEGDLTLCYIPDHEPALGAPIEGLAPEWISGYDLARGADLLIHDCQYTDAEYP